MVLSLLCGVVLIIGKYLKKCIFAISRVELWVIPPVEATVSIIFVCQNVYLYFTHTLFSCDPEHFIVPSQLAFSLSE